MKKVILKEETIDKIYFDKVKKGNIIIRVKIGDPSRLYILQRINGFYKWIALRSGCTGFSPVRNGRIADAVECTIEAGREVYIFENEQDLAMNLKKII